MALAFLLPVKMMAKASSSDNSTLLWYNAPAQQWLEALPIGNSHLGGMVYGGTTDENIQLNEETFWSGGPHNNNSKKSLENLPKVRELIFNGREEERPLSSTRPSSQDLMACASCRWQICISV